LDVEAQTPFLSINTRTFEKPVLSETQELDPSDSTRRKKFWHPYPYILNLGLLLVLLGTKDGSPSKPLNTLNSEYTFCKSQLKDKENWPHFDASGQVKEGYRRAVQYCIPESKKGICIDLAGRRQMLLDKVARPLFNLLQDMEDPIEGPSAERSVSVLTQHQIRPVTDEDIGLKVLRDPPADAANTTQAVETLEYV
jgi:hypothetical protein